MIRQWLGASRRKKYQFLEKLNRDNNPNGGDRQAADCFGLPNREGIKLDAEEVRSAQALADREQPTPLPEIRIILCLSQYSISDSQSRLESSRKLGIAVDGGPAAC